MTVTAGFSPMFSMLVGVFTFGSRVMPSKKIVEGETKQQNMFTSHHFSDRPIYGNLKVFIKSKHRLLLRIHYSKENPFFDRSFNTMTPLVASFKMTLQTTYLF